MQHNDSQDNGRTLLCCVSFMLTVVTYADCHKYAPNAKVIMLNVVMLSVVAPLSPVRLSQYFLAFVDLTVLSFDLWPTWQLHERHLLKVTHSGQHLFQTQYGTFPLKEIGYHFGLICLQCLFLIIYCKRHLF